MRVAITRKLNAAAKASATIIDTMDRAHSLLVTGNRCFNGYGILPDPSSTYGRLHDAKLAIDKAMAVYRATEWPTKNEYDAAEGAG